MKREFWTFLIATYLGVWGVGGYSLSICTDTTHTVFIGQGANGSIATLYYATMVAGESYTVAGFIEGEYYYIWFDAGHNGLMNDGSAYPANIGANIRPGMYPYSIGVPGGGASSYIVATGSCSGAPASFSKSVSVTNLNVTAEQYRFNVPAVGTNAAISESVTLNPGEIFTWNITTDYEWTGGGVERLNQLATQIGLDGQIISVIPTWTSYGPPLSSGAADSTYTPPSHGGSGGGGNIFNPAITAPKLGTQAPPSNPTPSTGGTDQANADARHLALRNLLVGISNNQRDRDAAGVAVDLQIKAAVDRVDADLRYGVSNIVGAVNALGTNFNGGAGNTYSATNGAAGGFVPGGRETAIGGLADLPVIGAGDPPMIVAPLDALSPGLGLPDLVLDFGDPRFAAWITPVRSFLLVCVTVGFLFASLRLVGRLANV